VNYEVMHGQRTHYIQAGNSYAACLDVLRIEAEENDVQQAQFRVIHLPHGKLECIPMASVLRLRLIALNPDGASGCDEQGAPPMDLTHW